MLTARVFELEDQLSEICLRIRIAIERDPRRIGSEGRGLRMLQMLQRVLISGKFVTLSCTGSCGRECVSVSQVLQCLAGEKVYRSWVPSVSLC